MKKEKMWLNFPQNYFQVRVGDLKWTTLTLSFISLSLIISKNLLVKKGTNSNLKKERKKKVKKKKKRIKTSFGLLLYSS